MPQNYNTVSCIVATSTMQSSLLWITWRKHGSHKRNPVLPTGYTAVSQNSVWMRYSLVAPVTPQQLYKGLKYKAKHLSTCHIIIIIEFCWVEKLAISQILDRDFQGDWGGSQCMNLCKMSRISFVLLATWADTYVLHLKTFLLAYMYFPLWFVGFACMVCCVLPEEYLSNDATQYKNGLHTWNL